MRRKYKKYISRRKTKKNDLSSDWTQNLLRKMKKDKK